MKQRIRSVIVFLVLSVFTGIIVFADSNSQPYVFQDSLHGIEFVLPSDWSFKSVDLNDIYHFANDDNTAALKYILEDISGCDMPKNIEEFKSYNDFAADGETVELNENTYYIFHVKKGEKLKNDGQPNRTEQHIAVYIGKNVMCMFLLDELTHNDNTYDAFIKMLGNAVYNSQNIDEGIVYDNKTDPFTFNVDDVDIELVLPSNWYEYSADYTSNNYCFRYKNRLSFISYAPLETPNMVIPSDIESFKNYMNITGDGEIMKFGKNEYYVFNVKKGNSLFENQETYSAEKTVVYGFDDDYTHLFVLEEDYPSDIVKQDLWYLLENTVYGKSANKHCTAGRISEAFEYCDTKNSVRFTVPAGWTLVSEDENNSIFGYYSSIRSGMIDYGATAYKNAPKNIKEFKRMMKTDLHCEIVSYGNNDYYIMELKKGDVIFDQVANNNRSVAIHFENDMTYIFGFNHLTYHEQNNRDFEKLLESVVYEAPKNANAQKHSRILELLVICSIAGLIGFIVWILDRKNNKHKTV